uniref:Uncharacterized protein n=1 Tax=Oryza sativa subsp. japonica TaxID=39947 RepID=Q6K6D6_ORYSJ|nr:hypothetical protein [Oryza sativa Japonica Group]
MVQSIKNSKSLGQELMNSKRKTPKNSNRQPPPRPCHQCSSSPLPSSPHGDFAAVAAAEVHHNYLRRRCYRWPQEPAVCPPTGFGEGEGAATAAAAASTRPAASHGGSPFSLGRHHEIERGGRRREMREREIERQEGERPES